MGGKFLVMRLKMTNDKLDKGLKKNVDDFIREMGEDCGPIEEVWIIAKRKYLD